MRYTTNIFHGFFVVGSMTNLPHQGKFSLQDYLKLIQGFTSGVFSRTKALKLNIDKAVSFSES